jgi:hypothetical protein
LIWWVIIIIIIRMAINHEASCGQVGSTTPKPVEKETDDRFCMTMVLQIAPKPHASILATRNKLSLILDSHAIRPTGCLPIHLGCYKSMLDQQLQNAISQTIVLAPNFTVALLKP